MMMMTICFNEATRLLERSRSWWQEEEQMDIISSEQLRKLKKIKPFGHSEASKKRRKKGHILLIFPALGKMTHMWCGRSFQII